jgi:hypothetical protein
MHKWQKLILLFNLREDYFQGVQEIIILRQGDYLKNTLSGQFRSDLICA